jgi:hypothetical protein
MNKADMQGTVNILISSRFTYKPSHDEWIEFWILLKDDDKILDNAYVNSLFSQWQEKGQLSPRQIYFLFRIVFPKTRLGFPPTYEKKIAKKFLD